MSAKRKTTRVTGLTQQFDQVWGIDRYLQSPYYGRLQVRIIHLWDRPGCEVNAANLTGALPHGSHVQVLARRDVEGATWYRVMADVMREGRKYRQMGWCLAKMLLERGKGEFDGNDADR